MVAENSENVVMELKKRTCILIIMVSGPTHCDNHDKNCLHYHHLSLLLLYHLYYLHNSC